MAREDLRAPKKDQSICQRGAVADYVEENAREIQRKQSAEQGR